MITRVKNIGSARFIGYLPPHGIQMAHNAELFLDGDLRSVLAGGRARYGRPTELASLDSDIANGHIQCDDLDDSSTSA